MLSDQRLSTSHATINMRLSIKINDALWSKDEKEMLIERALQIYHEKRRIFSLEEREPATEPPPTKKARTVVAIEEEETDNESADDESECHEDEDDED